MGQLENLNLRYPKDLVEEYGAKAGVLMYVAEQLPDIPQMPMVTSKIGEPARDFLKRVDQAGIKWPRLFRSSAVAELIGFEGDFPTHKVDTFKGEDNISRYFVQDGEYDLLEGDKEFNVRLEALVREITTSPQESSLAIKRSKLLNDYQLPSEINVIVAEFAPCPYTGTFIKHPNRPDFYLTTLVERARPNYKLTLTYNPRRGFYEFGEMHRNLIGLTDGLEEKLEQELETVIGWHDAIAGLPEMDTDWAYQIEFGLMPTKLFQVRPFKPMEKANFSFEDVKGFSYPLDVIGVTRKEGDDYEIASNVTEAPQTELPILFLTHMRWGRNVISQMGKLGRIPQSYFLVDCGGILEHEDVKILRHSKLTLMCPEDCYRHLLEDLEGKLVNVVSDGIQVRMTDKLTREEIF